MLDDSMGVVVDEVSGTSLLTLYVLRVFKLQFWILFSSYRMRPRLCFAFEMHVHASNSWATMVSCVLGQDLSPSSYREASDLILNPKYQEFSGSLCDAPSGFSVIYFMLPFPLLFPFFRLDVGLYHFSLRELSISTER
jgi:hypothetical protein